MRDDFFDFDRLSKTVDLFPTRCSIPGSFCRALKNYIVLLWPSLKTFWLFICYGCVAGFYLISSVFNFPFLSLQQWAAVRMIFGAKAEPPHWCRLFLLLLKDLNDTIEGICNKTWQESLSSHHLTDYTLPFKAYWSWRSLSSSNNSGFWFPQGMQIMRFVVTWSTR